MAERSDATGGEIEEAGRSQRDRTLSCQRRRFTAATEKDESGILSGFKEFRRNPFRWRRCAQPPANGCNGSAIGREIQIAIASIAEEKSWRCPLGLFVGFARHSLVQKLPQAMLGRRNAAYTWWPVTWPGTIGHPGIS